ncbi:MAG: OmpA family protein, partial [Planktomarina sp.]
AQARERLAEEEAISTEAQRQVELLRQQIKGLQGEIATLGGLLDASDARANAGDVELTNLGTRLNSALAEVALQARRVERLEVAEQERLQAEAERLAAEAVTLERYKSEFLGQVRELLEGREGVTLVGDRFVFSSEVLFPPGGATLSDAGEEQITRIASLLREIAADIPAGIDWVIQVDGHTDNVPVSGTREFDNNWELSQARALSVVLYMVNFLGLPPERLSANGFGQYFPLNDADTAEARSQNRRIELKFTER